MPTQFAVISSKLGLSGESAKSRYADHSKWSVRLRTHICAPPGASTATGMVHQRGTSECESSRRPVVKGICAFTNRRVHAMATILSTDSLTAGAGMKNCSNIHLLTALPRAVCTLEPPTGERTYLRRYSQGSDCPNDWWSMANCKDTDGRYVLAGQATALPVDFYSNGLTAAETRGVDSAA
jgi:hypothetical protein